ncbi:MAG: hypothetical protein KatS3mg065_1071 [Chloroflexota bacterium]|nr:MAG: hypothetical protein KatS3mg065_1071 [Chloroflexota bacterium]
MSSEDQHHVALPKLYGAPAYARPPRPVVARTPRPFDPDDLPLEAFMTPEERALKEAALRGAPGQAHLPATQARLPGTHGSGVVESGEGASMWRPAASLQPRPFRLRTLAARLLRGVEADRAEAGRAAEVERAVGADRGVKADRAVEPAGGRSGEVESVGTERG